MHLDLLQNTLQGHWEDGLDVQSASEWVFGFTPARQKQLLQANATSDVIPRCVDRVLTIIKRGVVADV